MSSVTPLLIWVFCVGIAALALGILIKQVGFEWISEGFVTVPTISITTCPSTTTSHITGIGDTECCEGDIVDNQCNGTTLCSLSPRPPNGLMTCTNWIIKEWEARQDRFCAPSLPYYFGTVDRKPGSKEGCSKSPSTLDGSAPRDLTQGTCKIYGNSRDDYSKVDSCFNARAKDAMAAPLPSATKAIIKTQGDRPALLQATYTPTNGSSVTPVSCFDWDRMVLYYNAIDPTGNMAKQYAVTKDTDYKTFCGASKAYYVNGTLTSGPTPYSNSKTYRVGDQVIFNGATYKMVEAAGAAGYAPDRPGDKLWSMISRPGISEIVSATYGGTCKSSLAGNRTAYIQQQCPIGEKTCNFNYRGNDAGGDPAPGCPKNLVINYKCSGSDAIKTFTLPGEAGNVSLSCGA